MKTNLLKTAGLLASLFVLSACPGKKADPNNVVPTVGPQGRITAFGTNTSCDFSNGTIVCSNIDQVTGASCNTTPRNYNNQDINSLCQEVRNIHNESLQGTGSCNVSAATARVLQEYCGGTGGVNPINPINPINPFPTQPARFLNCNVRVNDSFPTPVSLLAGNGPSSYTLYLTETKTKSLLKIINVYYPSSLGEVKLNYIPAKGRIPETLTVVGKIKDKVANRRVMVKHSGFANSKLELNAVINGMNLNVSCNNNLTGGLTLSDVTNLVCTGSSHMTSSRYEENIQFIRPLNSIVSGEEMMVTEAVSLSLDKASGMLTMRTNIDSLYGPDMTSTSSLRADALAEAYEGIGKAKITCSIK
jgi:hypothetical protein